MDTLIGILHVVGAVFVIGPMAILPQTGMRAIRSGDARSVRTLAKSTNIFTLISIVVAILGFGLVSLADPKDHLSFSTPWILASIIVYVVALALSLFLVVPTLRSAGEQMSEADFNSASSYRRVAIGSGLVSLLLLVVVVLMVWKP
jgi:uncharacterized membrane protein